jgi:predicted PurR-regulated permease PerM
MASRKVAVITVLLVFLAGAIPAGVVASPPTAETTETEQCPELKVIDEGYNLSDYSKCNKDVYRTEKRKYAEEQQKSIEKMVASKVQAFEAGLQWIGSQISKLQQQLTGLL